LAEIATAVLGCGVIGASWATAFRAAGQAVRLWDPDADAAHAVAARQGDGVTVLDCPETAVDGAAFVQESGPEDLAVKRELLGRIGANLGPHALVASSTSTLQASELQDGLEFADRLLVGHPFNPPHILPLVEVVGGRATAEWALEEAMRFYAALGKHPIRLRIERPGHLANRLQAALWREAVDAVASGQASVADVDAAVTLALGPRWALTGPFATFALGGGEGGLAHFLEHLGAPFEALWDDARRPHMTASLQKRLVAEAAAETGGSLRIDAQERDRRLRQILSIANQDEAR
jgi:carnitine 3-dehydrogenase